MERRGGGGAGSDGEFVASPARGRGERRGSTAKGVRVRRASELFSAIKQSECVFEVRVINVVAFRNDSDGDGDPGLGSGFRSESIEVEEKLDAAAKTHRRVHSAPGSSGSFAGPPAATHRSTPRRRTAQRSGSVVRPGFRSWALTMQVEDTAIPGKELNSDGYDDDDQQNCIQFSVPTELLDFHHHVSLQMSRRTSRGRMLRLECRIPLQGAKVSVDISRWYVAHTKNGRPKRSVLVSHTLRQQKGVALIKSLSIPKLISLGSIIPVNTKVHSTLFWQSFPSSQSLAHAQEPPLSPPSLSPPPHQQQEEKLRL